MTTIVSWGICIESVQPTSLTEDDFLTLGEITQDMWADGIGEFIQCHECHYMHSKKDIYGHLPDSHYRMTVRKIMWDFEVDNIACIKCGGSTYFVYWKANISIIKERYQKTIASFLVVATDTGTGKIVWYEDAYIDTLESIVNREYNTHYIDIWVWEIRNRIISILGYSPDTFMNLSDIGFLAPYRNLKNLAYMLHQFSQSIPDEYDMSIWFTEVDRNNILSHISQWVWWRSLGIIDDPHFSIQISNTSDFYQSDLLIYKHMWLIYKKYFDWNLTSLISLMRTNKMASIL
jgi:hypothetical protein